MRSREYRAAEADAVTAVLDQRGMTSCGRAIDMADNGDGLFFHAENAMELALSVAFLAALAIIDDIGAVVHHEPAKDVKDYLHRSGRTARAA